MIKKGGPLCPVGREQRTYDKQPQKETDGL